MPNAYLKSLEGKTKFSLSELESKWDSAKDIAKKAGMREGSSKFYAYTVGIFKKMTSLSRTCVPVTLVLPSGDGEPGFNLKLFEIRLGYADEYTVYQSSSDLHELMSCVNLLNRPKGRIYLVDASSYPVKELAVFGDSDPKSNRRIRGYAWWSTSEKIKVDYGFEL